jgi:hypothetical protein
MVETMGLNVTYTYVKYTLPLDIIIIIIDGISKINGISTLTSRF